MPFKHLFTRKQVFAVSCAMRRNLGRASTVTTNLLKMLLDLCSSWTRCFQILLRVPLDLRLAMFAAFDLVTKTLQPQSKL